MEHVRSRRGAGVVAASMLLVALAAGWMLAERARAQQEIHIVWPISSITSEFIDHGNDGLRLGDRLAARGPLVDVGQTEQMGYAYLDCVVMRYITDAPSGLYRCSYVLDLAPGQLVLDGMDPRGPGVYEISVLGGSGGYAGASGDATFTDSATGTDMVISLIS